MSDQYHSPVSKAKLVRSLFGQTAPNVTANAVGRVVAKLVPYKTHKQINASRDGFTATKMCWRFYHQLDMRFGLEYLIYLWLPRLMALEGDPVKTWEEFEEELEMIIHSTEQELITNYLDPAIRRQTTLYHL